MTILQRHFPITVSTKTTIFTDTKDSNLIDGSVNLIVFEKWLEKYLKIALTPSLILLIIMRHPLKGNFLKVKNPETNKCSTKGISNKSTQNKSPQI